MSPAAESVLRRLDETRQKWWFFTLLSTAVLALCGSLAVALVFVLVDALVQFSQPVLGGLFVAWLIISLTLLVLVVRRAGRKQRSLEATARRVEAELPQLGSNLINVVQLAEDRGNVDRSFVDAAVERAVSEIGGASFDDAAMKESRPARFYHCLQMPRDLGESLGLLGGLLALAVVCQLLIPNMGSAASRLMKPWEFVPSVGSVKILEVTPGDAQVLEGANLDIGAMIENPTTQPFEATLFIQPDGQSETSVPMTPDEKHLHYSVTLPNLMRAMTYRLEIGDSQTKEYRVEVGKKPTIAQVEVTFQYPRYLKRPDETFTQQHADLEAPRYTSAELLVRSTEPIASGHVTINGKPIVGRVDDRGALRVRLPIRENNTFTIHLLNAGGHGDPDPRVNRIRAIPDRPPTVELVKPSRQSSQAPGGNVPVRIRSTDDHGIGRVLLEMQVKADGRRANDDATAEGEETEPSGSAIVLPPRTVHEWGDFGGKSAVSLDHQLELPVDRIQAGQTVMIRATALDNRVFSERNLDLRPQEAHSGWHIIRIVAEEEQNDATLGRLDSLRGALFKILEKQTRARMLASAVEAKDDLPGATALGTNVRGEQVAIQKTTIGLVKSIPADDRAEHKIIKRILNALAFGEMLNAVQLCDTMTAATTLPAAKQPIPELHAAQDKVIETLRKMLDVTRRAQTEALAEMKKRPGGDLPPDVVEKLEDAQAKLDEFLEQQKRVIEATENLAKMPVEDFTEEEEQLLKRLATTEDDLAKFMKDLHSDLSKLPEQDFANGSLLKELNEIQTELKMAEDALLKKTADIAVPLEQLGAEMAEEIQTNIEKWLPDTPDRERWSQEESLSDEGKEAPMAELPGELEDLIGELMEEEEDLFDEMEDVSSSAADSLDKGAGWDVSDGPISNMSAKGATGNRLPNSSEIGGRSGEGRQGKSSGEFVGDEAVGKGGRKTPSRLTPDAFMEGQIKDHSKDPQGGATGGGKESGEGGEGLEGPQRDARSQRDLNRLAGKQASLRNKAEAVDLEHFRIMGYHHTDLDEMIDVMTQVERDLKGGRYENALRQRKVLAEGLDDVKQYLEGEFEVKQDATANLPGDIQKEILGAMQETSPAGWEEMNRRYFERLGSGEK